MRRFTSFVVLGGAAVIIVAVCVGWMNQSQFAAWGIGTLLVDLIERRLFSTDASVLTR